MMHKCILSFASTALLLCNAGLAHQDETAKLAPGSLRSAGQVTFATSCDAAVAADFSRGVALLHSFFYEEARNIFTAVAAQDPECAMAHWGIAQSWWHPIWAPPTPTELESGTQAARHALTLAEDTTPRERGFVAAINAYYDSPEPAAAGAGGESCHGPIGPRERVTAYERAMRKVYEENRQDLETQIWYAFAVLAVGYATPLDTTLERQREAGAMLDALWDRNRQHPGIAHYIIHAYDYPPLATRALEAAKAYADIAPWVPHALHMPSHIFTRLGMWDEAIAGNVAAAAAQRSYSKVQGRTAMDTQELHALDYMMYSYLQQARDAEARRVLDQIASVDATFPEADFVGAYALAAVPARFALERNAWAEAARLPVVQRLQFQANPFTEGLLEYAHALGRARTGDSSGARKAVARMAALRDATTDVKWTYFRKQLELQMQAAQAWLAQAEGRNDDAVALLRQTADAEDALGKHPVTPGALTPAREQLGDLLLMLNRPAEAQEAYEQALAIYPARFNSLYGAGRAAEAKGDASLARQRYQALLNQAKQSDGMREELAHARSILAGSERMSRSSGGGLPAPRDNGNLSIRLAPGFQKR